MNGLHIIAELHGCLVADNGNDGIMRDVDTLRNLCLAACQAAGLGIVAEAFHGFDGAGATGAVVLAESHLAVHTWPELDAVTLDIYVCNFSRDNRAAAEAAYAALHAAFRPKRTVRRDIERGL